MADERRENTHIQTNSFAFYFQNKSMEQYLRQRIDCPPSGGSRTLIEEKDCIIKKQQDELTKLQIQLKSIQAERDYLLSLLSNEQQSTINNNNQM